MNRIMLVLERIKELPLEQVLPFVLVIALLLAFTPRRFYFALSIIFFMIWMNISRFQGLGPVAALAKGTYWLPTLFIVVTAAFHSGPRRPIPPIYWIYLVIPFWAAICIATTNDRALGAIYQFNFFLSALAAILVLRTIVDARSLSYVLTSCFIGLLLPFAFCIIALLIGGGRHYHHGRFTPFGVGSNQIIPLLIQVMALGTYQFQALRRLSLKMASLAVVGIAAALILRTGSRQGVALVAAAFLPYCLVMIRRPIYMALFILVVGGGLYWVFAIAPDAGAVGRATNFEDSGGRLPIALEYLQIFTQRPATGLLGTHGFSIIKDPTASAHPHNSYLEMLYWGGLSLFVPLAIAIASTLYALAKLYWHRDRLTIGKEQTLLLASTLFAIYLHGLVGVMVYTSVSTWPFLHFLLSGLFLALAGDINRSLQAEKVSGVSI